MTPPLPNRLLTFEEYLEFEQASPVRNEFVGGEIYAMDGASRRHGLIVSNILARILPVTIGGPCQVFAQGFLLRVIDNAYYPDVMVGCSASDTDDRWAREPCLLVEVTSPSTARIDRTNKLHDYQSIASLRTYLIVEQAWRRVVRHRRDANGTWRQDDIRGDGAVMLPCPDVMLTLDQIYQGLSPLTVKELEALGYGALGAPIIAPT